MSDASLPHIHVVLFAPDARDEMGIRTWNEVDKETLVEYDATPEQIKAAIVRLIERNEIGLGTEIEVFDDKSYY